MSGILFYNSSNGEGATAVLDNAGNYTFVRDLGGFSKAWTLIVGAADGGVLFYNAASSEGATARLDNAGNYTFVRDLGGFSKGWTHIVTA